MQAVTKKAKGKEKPSEAKSAAVTTTKSNQSADKGKVPAKKNVKTAETKKPSANTLPAKGASNIQGRKKSVQDPPG